MKPSGTNGSPSRTPQYGIETRTPSAGVVTKTVHGAGKLSTGTHDLVVLSVAEYPTHRVLLLENPAGHVHAEPVANMPPVWLQPGTRVRGKIMAGPGFVVVRDVDRYQARDSQTKTPLGEWTTDIGQLYAQAMQQGVAPATTQLVELTHGTLSDAVTWCPVLHELQPPRKPTRQTPKD